MFFAPSYNIPSHDVKAPHGFSVSVWHYFFYVRKMVRLYDFYASLVRFHLPFLMSITSLLEKQGIATTH